MVVLPDRRVAMAGTLPILGTQQDQILFLFDSLGNPLPAPTLEGLGTTPTTPSYSLLGDAGGNRLWIVDAMEYKLRLWDEASRRIIRSLDLSEEMADLRAQGGATPPRPRRSHTSSNGDRRVGPW
jgi:hypothetical protein